MSNLSCNGGQTSSIGSSSTLLEMSQSSSLIPDSSQSYINAYDVEDSLDLNTKILVKKIHLEFKAFENIPENILYQNYQDCELGLELIKMHTGNCINFISNISCKFFKIIFGFIQIIKL